MKFIKCLPCLCLLFFVANNYTYSQKPNIIVVLIDDIGYKALTCDGGNLYSTPNIDSLSKNGMRFTGCHAMPSCSPSRFVLLTGKQNFRNYTEWGHMNRDQKTIGNMFKDAGYKTGCFGKWQLDGGDKSIKGFGFDEYTLHDVLGNNETGNRYKSPHIYTHAHFLSDNVTKNKYGPDITSDSLLSFLDHNYNNSAPFFVYYPVILVHQPFAPTPDDPEFATWNPANKPDKQFFPSMMSYMDKKVGELVTKLKALNIDKKTVILFTADNGTPKDITDYIDDDGGEVLGGKLQTKESGTHVPLIAYWPGTITPGTTNNDLIDFTDFLPTLAGIANIPKPTDYGTLDGVDFSPRLTGKPGTPRDWIFTQYNHDPSQYERYPTSRWAQTETYKLYDTSSESSVRLFYNIVIDPDEQNPIADNALTSNEAAIKQQLLDVINSYVAQGTALLEKPALISIDDTSAIISGFIQTNGCSTITSNGVVWSTNPNPTITSPHTTSKNYVGNTLDTMTGLHASTTYYVRSYATNAAGTAYSSQLVVKTALRRPLALSAVNVDTSSFTARWRKVANATSYRLDVSPYSTFSILKTIQNKQGFDNGLTPPPGWGISDHIITNNNVFGAGAPSLEFTNSDADILTETYPSEVTQLKFWMKGINTDDKGSLLIEGRKGTLWVTIQKINNLPRTETTKTYTFTSGIPLPHGITRFRFSYTKSQGNLAIDDINVSYSETVPSFFGIYNNLLIKDTFRLVQNLKPNTNYYYRVRYYIDTVVSGSSDAIKVHTLAATFKAANINNSVSNNVMINAYPNPSANDFSLYIQPNNKETTHVIVTDIYGKQVYESSSAKNNQFKFGSNFSSGIYIVKIIQGNAEKVIKLVKVKN